MYTITFKSIEELLAADKAAKAVRDGKGESHQQFDQTENEAMTKERWEAMTIAERLAFTDTEWTDRALKDLKPWALGVASVQALLDLCAAKPGEYISFKDVCVEAKMAADSARGQLRALTQKTQNHLGRFSWPVVANPTPPGRAGLAYIMDHSVAARWKAVRSAN